MALSTVKVIQDCPFPYGDKKCGVTITTEYTESEITKAQDFQQAAKAKQRTEMKIQHNNGQHRIWEIKARQQNGR